MVEWHGMPPEVNTGRLIAGSGAEPYLQAAAGWQAVAVEFTAAMAALRTQIAVISASWQGMAATQAQAAFEPYMTWMSTIIAMAEQRSTAAAAQAGSYGAAVAETPSLGEIGANHLTHAVLEATNFLGVNTVPIGVNEFEYLVVLWNRAAGAMDGYLAATGVNTTFPPFSVAPSVMAAPGAPEAGLAAILAATAAQLPQTAARDAILAELDGVATEGAARGQAQETGQLMATAANTAAQQGIDDGAASSTQGAQTATQMGTEMATQLPAQASQLVGQGPQSLASAANSPLQQVSSLFQNMGGGDLANQKISPADLASHFGSTDQLGAYGVSPVGSAGGMYGGAGVLSSATSGGTSPLRSPAGWSQPASAAAESAEQVARTTATPTGGSSAVGSGTGMMGPMAHSRGDGSSVALDEPVAEEKAVVTTLGFEVFDDGEGRSSW